MSKILHRNLKQSLPRVQRVGKHDFYDAKGNKYLDACGGAAVSCLGHNHATVIAAIQAQLKKGAYAHTSFFTNQPAENLAAYLVARAPKGFGDGRVMFLGSGSEAIEAALKLARQYHLERGETPRKEFIAREGSYHGNTLGALALGGHAGRRLPYEPMLMDVARIPACYAYRHQQAGESLEAYGIRAANYLEECILEKGPTHVAAFVAEPVSGATLGCVPPAPGYFSIIREICDRHGVLWIADEIMCGIGRTGSLFAIEQEGACPDILVLAKGLGAGYQPISAVMVSEKVVGAIEAGSGQLWNGHTYMCHAATCAGALAVLKEIECQGLLQQVRQKGAQLETMLKHEFQHHPHVGHIRGRGLFWALEFVKDKASKQPFPAEKQLAATLKQHLFECGLLTYPASGCMDGKLGDHLLLAPPFTVSEEELVIITRCLKAAFNRVFRAN